MLIVVSCVGSKQQCIMRQQDRELCTGEALTHESGKTLISRRVMG